jgi:tRNA-specific 2-thiouridylase
MSGARVAMAMSGGVDSSVAALLLHRAGRELVGVSLQLHDRAGGTGGRFGRCCSPRDFLDARLVAERVGFPFYVLDFEEEFRRGVLEDFVREYAAGRTPLPCAHCNSRVKFGDLLRRAASLGCDQVATGHYARRDRDPATGRPRLLRGRDPSKDQSYFLFGLSAEQLDRALFPVGDLTKDSVRELAREARLPVAEKPESQDVCFLDETGYAGFVEKELGERRPPPGEIVDRKGRVLGRHGGVHRYTVGQRRGLGLAGGAARYVVALRPETGQVVVGGAEDQTAGECRVAHPNWIGGVAPRRAIDATVRVRYRHPGVEATIEPHGAGAVRVRFRRPQRAVTPGQAAVFYHGDVVLGGGFIESAH